ncbi:MAG: NADP-dependent oxidoreductase [Deltaproteobacteria bacterium]|nr:NADP-dependent oxidoreductase [Deltaproteobacteria bacterium]
MSTMRAAVIDAYGPADTLRIADVPRPTLRPKDLLVRVHASSVNPVDTKQRKGIQRVVVRKKMPVILGMDVSGVVEEVGPEVTRFKPGDEVWSSPAHDRPGTWAEFVAVDEAETAHKPSNISHVEAASLPLVALTAWECFVTGPPVQSGQRVLVQAGSGGVGTAAIQLAKHLGAHVAVTCSPRNEELVRGLGADQVVDYRTSNYWEVLEPQDHVLEAIGPSAWGTSLKVLKRGGHMASIATGMPTYVDRFGPYAGIVVMAGSMLRVKLAGIVGGKTVRHVLRPADGEMLARIGELVTAGAIKPVVEEAIPLADIAEANRRVESGRTRGKIVVQVVQ